MSPDPTPKSPRRIWEVLTIALFLTLLWMPTLDYFFGLDHAPVTNENRLPAKWPRFTGLTQTRHFLVGVENYFNDHFGFRKRLMRWCHHWKQQLYGTAFSPNVLIGRDGWLFYSDEQVLKNCSGQAEWAEKDLRNWQRLLETRRDWLRERGIKYLFVIPPNKSTVYFDRLPEDWFQRGARPSEVQQFVKYMAAHSTVHVLDLSQPLIEARSIHPTFLKTDTHWNSFGGFVAYRSVVSALARQLPWLRALPMENFAWQRVRTASGDLPRLLGTPDLYVETNQFRAVPLKPLPELPHIYDPVRLPQSGMEATWPFFTLNTNASGKVIVIRDSFASSWYPFLGQHFNQVIYLWKYDGRPRYEWNRPLIAREKPDVVIDEMLERFFCTEDPVALMAMDKLSETKSPVKSSSEQVKSACGRRQSSGERFPNQHALK